MKSDRSKKQRVTVLMDPEVADRIRDAVYWTPGFTIASFMEQAAVEAHNKAEQARGEPFPKREGEVQMGRPVVKADEIVIEAKEAAMNKEKQEATRKGMCRKCSETCEDWPEVDPILVDEKDCDWCHSKLGDYVYPGSALYKKATEEQKKPTNQLVMQWYSQNPEEKRAADDEIRMTLRCPKDLIERIDKVREEQPGCKSRNQAIVEALSGSGCLATRLEDDESKSKVTFNLTTEIQERLESAWLQLKQSRTGDTRITKTLIVEEALRIALNENGPGSAPSKKEGKDIKILYEKVREHEKKFMELEKKCLLLDLDLKKVKVSEGVPQALQDAEEGKWARSRDELIAGRIEKSLHNKIAHICYWDPDMNFTKFVNVACEFYVRVKELQNGVAYPDTPPK